MTGACYAHLKGLRRAQLDACGIWSQSEPDVACNRHHCRAGSCCISMAGRRNLHGCGGWQVGGRGEIASGCNCSHARISTNDVVHTPAHASVRGVCHGGSERQMVSEQNTPARRRNGYRDRRRWWRRAHSSGSHAAAQHPNRSAQNCDKNKPHFEGFFRTLRKGKHALRKAGEGPANKMKLWLD